MKFYHVPFEEIPKDKRPEPRELFACKGPNVKLNGFRSPRPTLVVGFWDEEVGMIELGIFFNEKNANQFGYSYPLANVIPDPEYQ